VEVAGQAEGLGGGDMAGRVVDEQGAAAASPDKTSHHAGSLTRPVSTCSSLPPNSAARNARWLIPSRVPYAAAAASR
jgi:hypothetical protein